MVGPLIGGDLIIEWSTLSELGLMEHAKVKVGLLIEIRPFYYVHSTRMREKPRASVAASSYSNVNRDAKLHSFGGTYYLFIGPGYGQGQLFDPGLVPR